MPVRSLASLANLSSAAHAVVVAVAVAVAERCVAMRSDAIQIWASFGIL